MPLVIDAPARRTFYGWIVGAGVVALATRRTRVERVPVLVTAG